MKRKDFMALAGDDDMDTAVERCRSSGVDPEEDVELNWTERWFERRLRELESDRIKESSRLDEAFRRMEHP